MLTTWRYRERNSLVQSFDPRAWLIFMSMYMLSAFLFWDMRYLAFFFVGALFFVLTSGITWKESKHAWLFIGGFIIFFSTLTFLTGRGGLEFYDTETLLHEFRANFQIFGWTPVLRITAEKTSYAMAMMLRVFSIAALTIMIPYTLNPALYGITFHGLGLPDKFAFAMDLTMRFVPSFARDFQLTMDAQKARGLELEKGNFLKRIRNYVPVLIPLIVSAIRRSLELAEAMESRAWGATKKRTNLYALKFHRGDYILLAITIGILVLTIYSYLYIQIPTISSLFGFV